MTVEYEKRTDEELAALAKDGDHVANDLLLERHAGLVRRCARKFFLIGGETEDLVQEGMIGLLGAIRGYDEGKGKSFHGFAYLCVLSRLRDVVKTASKKKGVAMLPLDIEMVETGLSPVDLLILEEEEKELRKKMSKALSDFEFKVTTMYVDGMTYAEICEMTGKPTKSVDNALQRSKKKLFTILKK